VLGDVVSVASIIIFLNYKRLTSIEKRLHLSVFLWILASGGSHHQNVFIFTVTDVKFLCGGRKSGQDSVLSAVIYLYLLDSVV